MPRFFFWARQFGRQRALDLVASEFAELQQRCETADAEAAAAAMERHAGTASGGWCAPSEVIYDFLDLPSIGVKRGGVEYPKRSIDCLKMESQWT